MLSGFYTAASGMLTQQRTLNVLSNNIANVKTPGFKVDRVVTSTFETELLSRQEAGAISRIGSGSPIVVVHDVEGNEEGSSLEHTGQPFDIAIQGEGYFNIQGDGGTVYLTRNGRFSMDAQGFLVLEGVGKVLGKSGQLQVKTSDFTVSADGSVFDRENRRLDNLLISKPEKDSRLEKYSNGLYVAPSNQGTETVTKPNLLQKAFEQSNIDLNREYTLVMETQRNFQSCSTILKGLDQINQKTVTEIGKL